MNDVIVKVNDDNVVNVTHADAVDALKRAGTRVVLVSLNISHTDVTDLQWKSLCHKNDITTTIVGFSHFWNLSCSYIHQVLKGNV